ncbi:MAG TPA: glycosyltransferase family 87 protein [Rubrobacteraceae bacterium]|nr:glycosyltransferase family 87 protein [Rubrobacteraceae bacterium]
MRRAGVGEAGLFFGAFAVLLLSLWLDVRFLGETLERISTGSMDVHADFDTFWRSAEALWEGVDVYDTGARLENLNPPFWVLLIAPLGLLEPLAAYRAFAVITLAVTVGYLAWMAGELRLRGGWAVVAAAMLLLSSPLLATLALGQIYPILALGLVAAWVADRRGGFVLSGAALGLVVAVKPSLAPVLLWPLVRRRWRALSAAALCGAAATLLGVVAVGWRATLDWVALVTGAPLSAYWDNASLPSAAARIFTENEFAEPIVTLPLLVPVAYGVGIAAIIFTAVRVSGGSEAGLWALAAASLLASPIAWHNYLVLLGPGILVLLARGRVAPAFLLLALQSIPPQWPLLWSGEDTVLATLALTLYLYILVAHWLSFLAVRKETAESPA